MTVKSDNPLHLELTFNRGTAKSLLEILNQGELEKWKLSSNAQKLHGDLKKALSDTLARG